MSNAEHRACQSQCSPDGAKRNPGKRDTSPGFRRSAPLSGLHYLRRVTDVVRSRARTFWRAIRQLSGDDAYERYLAHHATHHPEAPLLTRAEFFRRWQDEKWSGMRRCC
ncbi:MAG: YbdD/YjiX family protein [Gammaproteobacteria bacterium]|nr:YbdD/YjiX family protein [Gammaproteobacteria bacterium]